MVFSWIRLRQIVVHAVAVQVPASLAEIVRSKLYPVLAGVYIAEVAEAQLMEICELYNYHFERMPVANI